MDNLNTEMLERMQVDEIAALPPDVLNELHWKIGDELVRARSRENKLHQAFESRYGSQASAALLADGRDTGTVHLTDGRFEVTVTRPKRIKWNDAALRRVLDSLDADTARHLAKVEVKVDERKFAALAPAMQALFSEARTVETGKATYALSERIAA